MNIYYRPKEHRKAVGYNWLIDFKYRLFIFKYIGIDFGFKN